MRHTAWKRRVLGVGLALLAMAWSPRAQPRPAITLSPPEAVAEGIVLQRSTDTSMLDPQAPAGPIGMALVRLDPSRVRLATALATRCSPARETVLDMAAREGAVVAINAGFFLSRGAPAGLLKQNGRWIGGTSRARGVAAFPAPRPGRPSQVLFTRTTLDADLRFRSRLKTRVVKIDHLSPQEASDGLALFAAPCAPPAPAAGSSPEARLSPPESSPKRPTATWPMDSGGRIATVAGPELADAGPRAAVSQRLEFRGSAMPRDLDRLRRGTRVTVVPRLVSRDAAALRDAPDAVGGAGLLVSGGVAVTDWSMERLSPTFATDRHPRSVIGVGADGAIWLIAVDGRQPSHSVGMSFAELQRLCAALGLRDALNLDGGGSTTLVVQGRIVNRPSDLTGPRAVGDAIVVRTRSQQSTVTSRQ